MSSGSAVSRAASSTATEPPAFDNVGERRQVGSLLGTGAGLVQRLGGTAGLHVGDGGDLHAGDAADLGDEPEAHLPCADQPDADRPAQLVLACDQSFGVAHGNS